MVTIQPNIPKLSELTHFDLDVLVMGLFFNQISLTCSIQSFFSILKWLVIWGISKNVVWAFDNKCHCDSSYIDSRICFENIKLLHNKRQEVHVKYIKASTEIVSISFYAERADSGQSTFRNSKATMPCFVVTWWTKTCSYPKITGFYHAPYASRQCKDFAQVKSSTKRFKESYICVEQFRVYFFPESTRSESVSYTVPSASFYVDFTFLLHYSRSCMLYYQTALCIKSKQLCTVQCVVQLDFSFVLFQVTVVVVLIIIILLVVLLRKTPTNGEIPCTGEGKVQFIFE